MDSTFHIRTGKVGWLFQGKGNQVDRYGQILVLQEEGEFYQPGDTAGVVVGSGEFKCGVVVGADNYPFAAIRAKVSDDISVTSISDFIILLGDGSLSLLEVARDVGCCFIEVFDI